jgi:hypothetical protein
MLPVQFSHFPPAYHVSIWAEFLPARETLPAPCSLSGGAGGDKSFVGMEAAHLPHSLHTLYNRALPDRASHSWERVKNCSRPRLGSFRLATVCRPHRHQSGAPSERPEAL